MGAPYLATRIFKKKTGLPLWTWAATSQISSVQPTRQFGLSGSTIMSCSLTSLFLYTLTLTHTHTHAHPLAISLKNLNYFHQRRVGSPVRHATHTASSSRRRNWIIFLFMGSVRAWSRSGRRLHARWGQTSELSYLSCVFPPTASNRLYQLKNDSLCMFYV